MLVNLGDMLKSAMNGGYAVGLFNTTDTDMVEAAISAAEEMRSPIIIGTAEVLLPSGELKLIAPSMIGAAKRASVPVAVHYDHGLTFERCMEALTLGFSSIMFDGSAKEYGENIAATRELVKIAHAMGATVEGEIGHVGTIGDGDDYEASELYTTPGQAIDYINATGVDALAIAIGTAHGKYIKQPKLDIQRLSEIRAATDIPLVLHGGSGLTDDDFRNTVKHGISKINIYTDLCIAGVRGMGEGIAAGECYLDIRDRKVAAAKEAVIGKMKLFGSVGKA